MEAMMIDFDYSISRASNSSESDYLFRVFPAEIWHMILGSIDNDDDLESCCNASSHFRQLLYSKRVLFLFPKVWEVLEKVVYRGTDTSVNGTVKKSRNEVPVPGGSTQDNTPEIVDEGVRKILKLRLVCQTWTKGFDKFYQRRLLCGTAEEVAYGKFIEKTFYPGYHRCPIPDLSFRFLAKFGDSYEKTCKNQQHKASPFISKTIVLHYNKFGWAPPDYTHNLSVILQNYELDKLTVKYEENVCMFKAPHVLRPFLGMMKNLKALDINVGTYFRDDEKDVDEIVPLINANPFFKMEQLKFLSLRNISFPFFDHFVRLNNQITHLKLCKHHMTSYSISSVPLPNLTHLEIWMFNHDEIKQLVTSNFSHNFKNLAINYFGFLSPDKIFCHLGGKWGNTLTHLRFNIKATYLTLENQEKYENNIHTECTRLQREFLPLVKKLEVKVQFVNIAAEFVALCV